MSKSIEDLIGQHPEKPNFFADWLTCEDILSEPKANKKYRKLSENLPHKSSAIEEIAQLLIKHLITNTDIDSLRNRKKKIYEKYSYEQHLEAQELIPTKGTVRQGNLGEIIFIEYLKALGKYDFLVYKFEYNPNISQSMKGDDILMFDKDNLRNILLGEAKYRSNSKATIIEEILESFGGTTKLPISLTFITRVLAKTDINLSNQLSEIQTEIKHGEKSIINAGFIISDKNISNTLEKHDFSGDFALTDKVIDELSKIDPNYPVGCLRLLIGKEYKTFTLLRERIQKEIFNIETGKPDEKKQKAKDWVAKKYKDIIYKYSSKKLNDSLFFLSIGVDNLDEYLEGSFEKAYQSLGIPETLRYK